MAARWANAVQLAMLACLLLGSYLRSDALVLLAAGLMLVDVTAHYPRLLGLARLFLPLAALAGAVLMALPDGPQALARAMAQGVGFAALMTVIALLRHPVRRSPRVQDAAGYLTSFTPRFRYGALNAGAMGLALLFNVGIITMIGDLMRRPDEAHVTDPTRRAMVVAAMRGAALVSIWSPLGIGFAIVIAGIPALNPTAFLALAAATTVVALAITARWPLLPPEATIAHLPQQPGTRSPRALLQVLLICALVLALTLLLHHWAGVSFTIASITVLPAFAAIWLLAEASPPSDGTRLRAYQKAVSGLGDMRSEGAIFMAANVIGTMIAALVGAAHLGAGSFGAGAGTLPVLLGLLVLIPLSAALYLPNSIVVVIAAQIFGTGPLGQDHPLALGLVLAVGWASAIAVSPVSAMNLLLARACGVSAPHAARRWNPGFSSVLTVIGAVVVSFLVGAG
ncbi:hypothetical protein BVG79_p1000112 (plasmid) [Ketogulonicigenium robustum]|uniref:Citrate transporter n=1 Tax=Ketogulonicigenium robustum TaxID=92947 RepID=A0A1W6P390_9RHOB|nr:hypothetical protein [Ketogulonicigenium robustum]ARO15914.1 hypothetical protein BVG79_p1000112 [Ketogulonicigenium robustum]